jgi:hypothetical protein
MPQALTRAGVHVLCAGSRFAKNDTPLIMEKVLLDLGAYIRHAKERWGYEKILLCGWSGGGSLALFYQSQAEKPTVRQTPSGEEVNFEKLVPADAMIFQAAHLSRARMLSEWIDPSVVDESDPDRRDLELDIYNPKCPNQPPYTKEFVARFRGAQLARLRKRTQWVKETLQKLKGDELERGYVPHHVRRALHGPGGGSERPQAALVLPGQARDRQYRPGGDRPFLHPARLAVAMVGGRLQRRRAEVRQGDQRAAARDRELGR